MRRARAKWRARALRFACRRTQLIRTLLIDRPPVSFRRCAVGIISFLVVTNIDAILDCYCAD
jgi:hypothetical protein